MEDTGKKKKEVTAGGVEKATNVNQDDLKDLTLEELNTLLGEVLEQEDYLKAIAIRDEINSRRKNRG
jgi:protein-arginine kinase activator protein McsA